MSYIICFWDKSKLQVNEETGIKLQNAIVAESIKNFKLGANLYAVSGVEKIITKDDAYTTFPTEFQQLQDLTDLPQLESYKLPGENETMDNLKKLTILNN